MKYQEVKVNEIAGTRSHIVIELEKGATTSFPAENENPSYISFLRQLSEENPDDPHFVAWVEAGNNPEDFWAQSEVE